MYILFLISRKNVNHAKIHLGMYMYIAILKVCCFCLDFTTKKIYFPYENYYPFEANSKVEFAFN